MHDNILYRFDQMSPSNSCADDLFTHGIGKGPADNNSRSVCTFSLLIIIYKSNIQLYEFFCLLGLVYV